jgi:ABC-type dipeptide/oligopeptide/nickel transport system permease component/ABC-type transport system substrate-binding protein
MRRPTWIFNLSMFVGIAIGLVAVLMGLAWLARPDLTAVPPPPAAGDVAELQAALTQPLDPKNPLRLQVEVDYAQGVNAAWWPKNESPVIADLVRDGKLPPVGERVGPEPCVYRGVDGIGQYGGTWVQESGANALVHLSTRQSACTLMRWSPQGFPIVPHVAKSMDASSDYKTYTFTLRKGMRWSDGASFTADDIMYWWLHEATDKRVMAQPPPFMFIGGKLGRVEKVDDLTVRFVFPEPHGLFLMHVATFPGAQIVGSPSHYLKRFHPDPNIGDAAEVARLQQIRRLPGARDVYLHLKEPANPEHPRLWPWLYHKHQANAPFSFVRNPYYWMVDEAGNQLPYIDRIYAISVAKDMASTAIIGGQFPVTVNKTTDYTLLMSGREKGNYRTYRWIRADASDAMIHVNLNRRVEPDKPDTKWKHQYLNEPKFRQALSLAINRQAIIEANYFNETEPAQCAPLPGWYFYHERAFKAFTEFDTDRANRLLDEIGLTRRDLEGMRTAPDGTTLTFFLNHAAWLNPATSQFIVDDWARVGIRALPRVKDSRLFYTEKSALLHDFTMWTGDNEMMPVIEPRTVLPSSSEANFAPAFANWYTRGGLYGDPRANDSNCIPIPEGHPLRRGLELYEQIKATGNIARQKELFDQILDIQADNLWTIGLCSSPRYVVTVANNFHNVPRLATFTYTFIAPGNTGLELYFFDKPEHPRGVTDEIKREIVEITPEPDSIAGVAKAKQEKSTLGGVVKWLVCGTVIGFVLLLAVRHPFVGRRILIMVPTLFFISIVVFTIIELPPGDYLTSRIMELQMRGDQVDMQELDNLKKLYHLEDPTVIRYLRWLGVYWFKSFEPQDEGLLQGNLGRSMASNKEVSQIVGDRILLTIILSLGSILITWAVAMPIGIYSAVRQYSIADYVFTFVGFIGMCIPSFLLAVIMMYLAQEWFGLQMVGLFSPKYALQPYWDWAKLVDLLKHLWLPVAILGIGSTGGMIRVMRGNLLDELKKPYVTTARAKGVRPMRLLLKYPVRLALNPFISGIGGLFPALISGGTLISVVLSLPTVGPLMLDAMLAEDTLLAGSMLMVLSLLGVFGVLVSDLLLLWLDPRIRFEEGTR